MLWAQFKYKPVRVLGLIGGFPQSTIYHIGNVGRTTITDPIPDQVNDRIGASQRKKIRRMAFTERCSDPLSVRQVAPFDGDKSAIHFGMPPDRGRS